MATTQWPRPEARDVFAGERAIIAKKYDMQKRPQTPARDAPEPVAQDAARHAAKLAGLHYVHDAMPGLRRRRRGASFTYLDAHGARVTDPSLLARIAKLAIPPAWTEVWICASAGGHLQATGRDARGRKQYRYHAEWRVMRSANNFARTVDFGEALPRIRKRIERDLKLPGLPCAKVVAGVVRLLDATAIRVGSAEYARDNHSFGLTTLRRRHVEVSGRKIRFRFQGKSSKQHSIELADRRIANIIRRCQELPGKELFNYLDENGAARDVTSDDVNRYLQEAASEQFTAKDFRTWVGTVAASCVLSQLHRENAAGTAKQHFDTAVKAVALHLGNTPTVCRKYYIHPGLADAHLDATLFTPAARSSRAGLDAAERRVLDLLKRGGKEASRSGSLDRKKRRE